MVSATMVSAFTLVLDTGTFQDHTDQGKQRGWHGVLLASYRKPAES